MALEGRWDDEPGVAPAESWDRLTARIQQRLRRAEDALEQAASAYDQLRHMLVTGSAPVRIPMNRRSSRPERTTPVASAFAIAGPLAATFVVHGVEFRVEFGESKVRGRERPVKVDLLALLAMETKQSVDDLVGFKTTSSLVRALRARGFNATRSSVTTEIRRLRDALGSINQDLIENTPGTGYRFRLRRHALQR